MRIGLITHNYPASRDDRQNAGIFVYDLAHALKSMGHEVFVLCPDTGFSKETNGVSVTWFPWAGRGKKLGDLRLFNPADLILFLNLLFAGSQETKRFCQQNRIDFVVGMWAFPAGVFALWVRRVLGIPYCLWALGSDIYTYAKYPILGSIIKLALKNANFLVADGIDLARCVEKLSGKECRFLPSASRLPTEAGRPIRHGPIKFVYLGRMEPVKGPDILISAVCAIKDLDFKLHLLGDGSLLPSLKKKIRQMGLEEKVIFMGKVGSPKVIYEELSSSDWLVIPSRSDSIPLVFSEGAKAGVPLIVAQVGDMVELVRKYKVGLSFPKEDAKRLTEILKDVLSRGRKATQIYEKGLQKLASLFDIDSSAKKLLSMIEAKTDD